MTNKQRVKVWTMCLACAAIASAPLFFLKERVEELQVEKVFVCYDDGELVEIHAGVEKAWGGGYRWEIHYIDSDIIAYYTQPEGETCMVEEVQ